MIGKECSITLYKTGVMRTDKNFFVESLETFLSNVSEKRTFTGNFFKHAKETILRLPLGQDYLDQYTFLSDYDFCKIKNSGTGVNEEISVYYFITNKKWISAEIVELSLYMDSVSTLGLKPLTNKCLIHRQHKNRFRLQGGYAYGIIDKTIEGISPNLYKTNEITLSDETNGDQKWYIVFQNADPINETDFNQVNPVYSFIIPQFRSKSYSGSREIQMGSATPLLQGYYYIISSFNNRVGSDSKDVGHMSTIAVKRSGGTITYYRIYDRKAYSSEGITADRVYFHAHVNWGSSSFSIYYIKTIADAENNIITQHLITSNTYNVTTDYLCFLNWASKIYMANASGGASWTSPFASVNFSLYTNEIELAGFNDIDRTDSKIIRVIELPYLPLECSGLYGDNYLIDVPMESRVLFTDNSNDFYGLTPLNEQIYLKNRITTGQNNAFEESDYLKFDPSNLQRNATRDINYETKLLSTEFLNKKFVYDSFSYTFKYEDCNIANTIQNINQTNFAFDFYTSMALTSKFMFDFKNTWVYDVETADYDNLLCAARNNEVVLYSSQYLNYIRTGLQYDLKNKDRQTAASTLSTIMAVVGGAAGVAVGVAAQNPAVAVGSVISATTAITSSVTSAVNSSISMQQALEQKKAQAQAQANSVSGADDLPLLNVYTEGNKAKICEYKPTQAMEESLFNLFFYTGYAVEKMGLPELNTRNRFNYIQADIDINYADYTRTNLPNEIFDDYKGRFAVGLTIIHYYNGTWDFEQEYENWETIFETYLQ